MNHLYLSDKRDVRFITCYFKEQDGKLIKKVEIYTADYRQQVLTELTKRYGVKYSFRADESYRELPFPHIKYCRELNTEFDEYIPKVIRPIEDKELEQILSKLTKIDYIEGEE